VSAHDLREAGGTLRDRLHDGPLPPPTVADLGIVVAETLAHVHAEGRAHGDVRPPNIRFAESGVYLAAAEPAPNARPADDIHDLGALLIDCLTGPGSDPEATWGPRWRSVLAAMISTDPDDRPDATTCAKLLAAIEPGPTRPLRVPLPRRPRARFGDRAR
jgi:eukaryotic-like serine/threonine-protein kinase